MGVIFKREFKKFFRTSWGYIFLSIFCLAAAILFLVYNLMKSSNSLVFIFEDLLLVSVILFPLAVMIPKYFSEKSGEKRLFEILPFTTKDKVLGGFFANLFLVFLSSLVTILFAFITDAMGEFNYKNFFASYLMFLLLCAFVLSVCRFFSAAVKNQVVSAFIYLLIMVLIFLSKPFSALMPKNALFSLIFYLALALAVAVIFFFVTKKAIASSVLLVILMLPSALIYLINSSILEGSAEKFISNIAIFDIVSYSSAGILDLGAAIMFFNITAFLIYLTVRTEDRKKLREVRIYD